MDTNLPDCLFPEDELQNLGRVGPRVKVIEWPIWTENKARLIQAYLRLFVMITHHGTYIDGFAGPQKANKPDMWAANLVLASEPRWFRHFYLYDIDPRQVELLEELKRAQPTVTSDGTPIKRAITVGRGDFNKVVTGLLASKPIRDKEATFCLLDQRTFECDWATVEALAHYKPPAERKIELFYFLAIGWLRRALAAQRDLSKLQRWWGRDDLEAMRSLNDIGLAEAFASRFREELGYTYAMPWPIRKRHGGGRVMHYMIHATDHSEAPLLMSRAYHEIHPAAEDTQLPFEF